MTKSIGLISDTHMPDRWRHLPDTLIDIFAGVDLILHAGDVGKLTVLDTLAEIAPVVAVHGNDEEAEAVAALPYQQVIAIDGHRILLSHFHYPDRAEEMASREIDAWEPKLRHRADRAKQHGADIVVFGHTHIAMAVEFEDVLLINPGAIASGGHFVRQTVQTVARLELNGTPQIKFFTLDGNIYEPTVDLEAGFKVAIEQVTESIASPVQASIPFGLLHEIFTSDMYRTAILNQLRPRLYPLWETRNGQLSVEDFITAAKASLPSDIYGRLVDYIADVS